MHMTGSNSALADLLRSQREHRGWSLEETAKRLSVALSQALSANAVWKWEQGQSRPGVEKWAVIEIVYRLPRGSIERAITGREPDVEGEQPAGYDAKIRSLSPEARQAIDFIIAQEERGRGE